MFVDCLMDSVLDRLSVLLMHFVIVCQIDRLIGCVRACLCDCLSDLPTDCFIDWLFGLLFD